MKTDDDERISLSAQLSTQGLTLRDVEGDGNCLFRCCLAPVCPVLVRLPDDPLFARAISDQLDNTQDRHGHYRNSACDVMLRHRTVFSPSVTGAIDAYVARMRRDEEWGDHVENLIVASSLAENVNVLLYRNGEVPFYLTGNSPERRTVHLGYVNKNHYVSVRGRCVPTIPRCATCTFSLLSLCWGQCGLPVFFCAVDAFVGTGVSPWRRRMHSLPMPWRCA